MAGLALGAILTSSIEKSAIDRSKNETALFITAEVDRVFLGMDFSLPMTGPRYEDFEKRVSHLKFNPSIKRIKVWNPDSVIVWSDKRQLVGKQFLNDKELLEALNGTVSSKIISPDNKPETRSESQYSRLLELYIPIRSEREDKVRAVFEIYQDLEGLDADTSRLKRTLWIAIFGGFTGIYFACFGIVWRASRRLTEQTLEVEKSEEKNRALAQELTSLINNVPGIVYRGHRDWSLSFIGAKVEPVTGYPPDMFTSGAVGWKEIIHPDDIEQVKEAFRKADKEKADTLHVEYRIRHRDGGIRWIVDRRQLIYLESGGFAYVDGLLLDITELKKVEDNLRESEGRYRDLVEHSQDLICTHDLQGRLLSVNPWAARALGYSQDEILRMNMRDLIAPEVRDEFDGYLEEIGKHGAARGILLVQTRNGERRIWEYNNTLRTKGVTEPVVRGMAQDVTERKRAEEIVKESEEKFRLIFDNASDGILLTDTESMKFEMGNRKICEMLGYSEEEILRLRVLDIHPEKDLPYVLAELQKGATGGINMGTDIPMKRKDGSVFISDVATSSITFHGKQYLMGIFRDLTRERILQKQVQTAQRMDSVGTLAGGIAHDFNNALTGIMGFGELMRLRLAGDSKSAADLNEILRCAERAATLTRQLLTFARRQVIEPANVNLNTIVVEMMKLISKVAGEHIEVKTALAKNLPTIYVDQAQLEQVIMNLCLNARDAMPDGGTLTVETVDVIFGEEHIGLYPYMKVGRYAALMVSDTGIGMDEKTLEKVFEPFFTTKGPDKGTGLGLAMVYGIVKQNNGYIQVYSEPGKGAAFRVYFPAVEAPPDVVVKRGQEEGLRGGTETILVAEDEETVRSMVVRVLKESGYTVLVARNGEEAIESYSMNKGISLAVLDVVMPKKGGMEAFKAMQEERPGLKVVFTSGYSAEAIHESFVSAPGVQFLPKPYTPNALIRKVREVLDGK